MFKIDGTHITLTRGDSFSCQIKIYDSEGEEFTPTSGDSIKFAMKHTVNDRKPIIKKDIPIDTMLLKIEPEDTKKLDFGSYIYDIQITLADGTVDTFITEGKFDIAVEVD